MIDANDGLDIAWLGLERHGEGHWSFELTPPLTRFDGKLYGGTGIAVTTAAMEAESGRGAIYATVQFVGSADIGERVDCHVEVLAHGRRTSQVRVTASVGDRIVLAAVGATGDSRDSGFDASFGEMPEVTAPENAGPWRPHATFELPEDIESWLTISDLRQASPAAPGQAMWARMRDMRQTRATLGFLADMVPSSVVRARGLVGGGISLDNSMRFGPQPDTEWILIDFDPYLISDDYAHGAARLWSSDGVLLGVASQTAALRLFPLASDA